MSKLNMIAEPGKQDVTIWHVFDGPRDLVFKIYTDPKLIPQWWGPARLTTTVEEMEVQRGGRWHYTQRDLDGSTHRFYGVYHDIAVPERIVYTFEFDGAAGHVLLSTTTFEEEGGKTKVTDHSVCQSVEDRDAMLQSGMESGVIEGFERVTALIGQLQG